MKAAAVNLSKLAIVALVTTTLTGCIYRRSREYETEVDIERMRVVAKDEAGNPLTTDLELNYRGCPGDQDEVIRGGPEFSRCIAKHKPGDKVKIKIIHRWDPEGHYVWDVVDVDGCTRTRDPNDEASYAMIRECHDWQANGVTVGFECNISPRKELLKACPWFAKR